MKAILLIFILALQLVSQAEIKETFEDGADQTEITAPESGLTSQWRGVGHIEALDGAINSPAGFPQQDAQHSKVLSVVGSVVVENPQPETPKNIAQVDYLQQVVETEEPLTTSGLDDVQIAVATGKRVQNSNDVELWLYCLPKGETTPSWIQIGQAQYGSWMRVNLAFNYTSQRCRVSINGIPVVSDKGYLLSEEGSTEKNGSWYRLGASQIKERVKSLQFVGVNSQFEDITISEKDFEGYKPFSQKIGEQYILSLGDETWKSVNLNDINRWGINLSTDISNTVLDNSGLTIAEKLEVGYDPLDNKALKILDLTARLTDDSSALSNPLAKSSSVDLGDKKDVEEVSLHIPQAAKSDDIEYKIRVYSQDLAFDVELPGARRDSDDDLITSITAKLPPETPRVVFFELLVSRQN